MQITHFTKLIQVNKKGIAEGIAHMQEHHIWPKAGAKTQELFKRAGMSIDDKSNLIHLPDSIAKDLYLTNRSMHSGKHHGNYTKFFKKQAEDILKQGKLENWTPEKYKSKLMNLTVHTREALRKGATALNDAKTLLEKVKK